MAQYSFMLWSVILCSSRILYKPVLGAYTLLLFPSILIIRLNQNESGVFIIKLDQTESNVFIIRLDKTTSGVFIIGLMFCLLIFWSNQVWCFRRFSLIQWDTVFQIVPRTAAVFSSHVLYATLVSMQCAFNTSMI